MKHRLKVWGDFACFTRPEMKVERVSYDIITPSAARAIFEAILFSPLIKWHIEMIEILNPIKSINIRRNELSSKAFEEKEIIIEEDRVQRSSLFLRDVSYVIHARLQSLSKDPKLEKKFNAMFIRRASKGQCFTQPYLGCREFSAYFHLLKEKDNYTSIHESKELGLMLHDMDYSEKEILPRFFSANMINGKILIPSIDNKEICK